MLHTCNYKLHIYNLGSTAIFIHFKICFVLSWEPVYPLTHRSAQTTHYPITLTIPILAWTLLVFIYIVAIILTVQFSLLIFFFFLINFGPNFFFFCQKSVLMVTLSNDSLVKWCQIKAFLCCPTSVQDLGWKKEREMASNTSSGPQW